MIVFIVAYGSVHNDIVKHSRRQLALNTLEWESVVHWLLRFVMRIYFKLMFQTPCL